jgi:hypothetical protein
VPERRRTGWSSRRSLIAVTAVAVVLAATSVLARGDGHRPDGEPGHSDRVSDPSRHALTVATIRRQARAVDQRNRSRFVGQYDERSPGARRQARMVYDNLTAIPVSRFEARYVRSGAPGASATVRGEWAAEVHVSWSIQGIPGAPTTETLTYTFLRRGGRAYVASIAPEEHQRTPVWLLGALHVRRSARTLVLGLDPATVGRVAALLRIARRDVSRVVTWWRGDLVAVVPRSAAEVGALLDAPPDSYAGIAALTTAQDGSRRRGSVPVIVVNPAEFDRLGPLGARAVITHESTHAATRANTSALPLWLAEGFADYVGIGAAGVPLRVAAARIIRQVRASGSPMRLPTRAAFGVGRHHLEATYESAWLACRLLAATYGRPRLVAFYTAVERHPGGTRAAFRTVLGTTAQRFTAQWRRHLRELADVG